MNKLLKQEKNENQHVISHLMGNPAECKSLLNIMPLDSRVKPENDKEVGRSMVEMLGVLAVMGIIGMAGLSAFNHAMNSHRANEVLYEVSKRAYGCMAQINLMGRACNLAEYGDKLEGYATSTLSFPNNYFGIKVAEVPEKICRQIHNKGLSQASQILPETCAATNDMIFIFDSELKGETENLPQTCDENTSCGECEICSENGFCESACTEGQACAKDFENPANPKACYPTDHIVEGVYCANPDGEGNCCDSNGANCCPPDKPIMGKNGTCYGCDENVIIEVQKATGIKNCGRCDNRNYRDAQYNNIGWCLPNECPTDKPVMDVKGVCHACEERAQMKAWTRSDTGDLSSCETCTENGILDNLFCTPCPNGMTNENGVCACPEGEMVGHIRKMTGDNWSQLQCYSCGTDNLNTIIFWRSNTNACQEQCPDRTTVLVNEVSFGYTYSFCALATCPTGYMHDRWGNCKSCTQSENIEFKPSSLENSCSECNGFMYTDGNYCKKCPTDISGLTPEQQVECTNG